MGINYSEWRQDISFNFFNPYFTIDGIGLGYGAYYRKTDYGNFNIAAYNTDSFGGSVRFQLPISEIESLGLSIALDSTKLKMNTFSSRQLWIFMTLKVQTLILIVGQSLGLDSLLIGGFFRRMGLAIQFHYHSLFPEAT